MKNIGLLFLFLIYTFQVFSQQFGTGLNFDDEAYQNTRGYGFRGYRDISESVGCSQNHRGISTDGRETKLSTASRSN